MTTINTDLNNGSSASTERCTENPRNTCNDVEIKKCLNSKYYHAKLGTLQKKCSSFIYI